MAVNNINNPGGAGEAAGRMQNITPKTGMDRADRNRNAQNTQNADGTAAARPNENTAPAKNQQPVGAGEIRDTFMSTTRELSIDDLVAAAQDNEAEPRQDKVELARERVRTDFYNDPQTSKDIASQLINTIG